jgi:hypothetical protein
MQKRERRRERARGEEVCRENARVEVKNWACRKMQNEDK